MPWSLGEWIQRCSRDHRHGLEADPCCYVYEIRKPNHSFDSRPALVETKTNIVCGTPDNPITVARDVDLETAEFIVNLVSHFGQPTDFLQRAVTALGRLDGLTSGHCDQGPAGRGWPSPALRAAREEAAAVAQAYKAFLTQNEGA